MKSFIMLGQSNMAGRGEFGEVSEIYRKFGKRFFTEYKKWKESNES